MVTATSTYRAELTSRLRVATEDIAWAIRGLDATQLGYRANDREWSAHEHLAHLRDMEQEVYLPLLRWATVPEMLDPRDYSRKAWREQRYKVNEPPLGIMNDIARIRDEELAIFREMPDFVWSRHRNDSRWGPLTCQWLAELMYRHVLDHMQSLMALRQDIHLAAITPAGGGLAGVTSGALLEMQPLVVGGYIGGPLR